MGEPFLIHFSPNSSFAPLQMLDDGLPALPSVVLASFPSVTVCLHHEGRHVEPCCVLNLKSINLFKSDWNRQTVTRVLVGDVQAVTSKPRLLAAAQSFSAFEEWSPITSKASLQERYHYTLRLPFDLPRSCSNHFSFLFLSSFLV